MPKSFTIKQKTPQLYRTLKTNYFQTIGYQPEADNPLQAAIHYNRVPPEWGGQARLQEYITANRLGKTYSLAKDLSFDLQKWFAPITIGIVAPNYKLGRRIFNDIYDTMVFDCGWKPIAKSKRPPFWAEWSWGPRKISRVEVWTAEKPDEIQAERWHRAVLDEAPTMKSAVWANVIMRMLDVPDFMATLIGTPAGGRKNFAFDKYKEYSTKADFTDGWLVRNFPLFEVKPVEGFIDWKYGEIIKINSPRFTVDRLESARRELSEIECQEKLAGLFVGRAGLVYPNFREEDISKGGHTCTDQNAPEGWENWFKCRCFDEGKTNPQVCVSVAVSPDGTFYCYEEFYERGYIASQAVEIWHNKHLQSDVPKIIGFPPPNVYAGDPNATNTIGELSNRGNRVFVPTGKRNEVVPRLNALSARIAINALIINRDRCPNSIFDITHRAYPEGKEGMEQKEKPLKVDDHFTDAVESLNQCIEQMVGASVQFAGELTDMKKISEGSTDPSWRSEF